MGLLNVVWVAMSLIELLLLLTTLFVDSNADGDQRDNE